jgi:hypothetical protein
MAVPDFFKELLIFFIQEIPKIQNFEYEVIYSSAQKNLNDHSIWHKFFVYESIGLKFWLNLHISTVHFLAKNWRDKCFLKEVMIF